LPSVEIGLTLLSIPKAKSIGVTPSIFLTIGISKVEPTSNTSYFSVSGVAAKSKSFLVKIDIFSEYSGFLLLAIMCISVLCFGKRQKSSSRFALSSTIDKSKF
jgi:hypothetical protein